MGKAGWIKCEFIAKNSEEFMWGVVFEKNMRRKKIFGSVLIERGGIWEGKRGSEMEKRCKNEDSWERINVGVKKRGQRW